MQSVLVRDAWEVCWCDGWHSSDSFVTPAKLRLQQLLRTRFLKCDLPEPGARQSAADILAEAAKAPANAARYHTSSKSQVWVPAAPASIDGQVVFGPWAMAKEPVTFNAVA